METKYRNPLTQQIFEKAFDKLIPKTITEAFHEFSPASSCENH